MKIPNYLYLLLMFICPKISHKEYLINHLIRFKHSNKNNLPQKIIKCSHNLILY